MARRKKQPKLTSYQAFLAEYGKGYCVNCGFLCKMVWNDLSHIDQIWDTERATLYNRESGHLFTVKANTIKAIPICYVGAADIDWEVSERLHTEPVQDIAAPPRLDLSVITRPLSQESTSERTEAAREVITKDRKCPHWIAWVQHRPPEWHLDQARIEALEKQRKEWTAALDAQRRSQDERDRKLGKMLAIAALILGLFQLLSAFAAPVILKWLGFHAG